MSDEDLNSRCEAIAANARAIKARAEKDLRVLPDLLRDLAEYLGDRPATDREANRLYERVLAMLEEGGE